MAILDHAEESLIRLNELAKMLKAVREERDLTLIEAAKEIGLSSATSRGSKIRSTHLAWKPWADL